MLQSNQIEQDFYGKFWIRCFQIWGIIMEMRGNGMYNCRLEMLKANHEKRKEGRKSLVWG